MFKQLDVVHIITTKNIKFLSGPEGQSANPNGYWSIVGFVGHDAIVSKENTIAKVPLNDLKKVGSYDRDQFFEKLKIAGFKKNTTRIDLIENVAKELNISILEARDLMVEYNFPSIVNSIEERNLILERVKTLWQRKQKKI